MLDFLKDYTVAEILEDVLGAVVVMSIPFLFPYAVAILKAIL
jgi:hypothetical protein